MTYTDVRERQEQSVALQPTPDTVAAPIALRVAYIMSRFPKLTETFVMNEIVAMKREVQAVEIYPLIKERGDVVHDTAAQLADEAYYTPFLSLKIARENIRAMRRQGPVYRRTLRDLVRETRGNRRFLLAGLALYPKAVYLAARFKERGIDHIHAHFATHPATAAFIISRFTGIPYSFTGHGSDLHRFQDMLCLKVQEAAFVVAISQYNRQFIIDHCGPQAGEKIRVIHCGVDLQEFSADSGQNGSSPSAPSPQAPPPPQQAAQRPVILCIGTLHEVKGQRYLLEALALLKEDGLLVQGHFVGDGPDRAMLETLAQQLGIGDQITFFGPRSRRQVVAHLQEATMLVTPSVPSSDGRREGIPVVLIEAMASGVPVVASRLSGIPELVRDGQTGLLADAGDAQQIAAAVRRFVDDPALARRLSEQARAYVDQAFNLQRSAANLAQHFAEAVR